MGIVLTVAMIYSVIYVEVMPTSEPDAARLLTRYRDAARAEEGSVRCEVLTRIGQSHHFAILEIWRDQAAFDAHAKSTSATEMRDKIRAIENAPIDERVHVGVSVGPVASAASARGAIYVVTHVDVIPPRKDDGLAALKQLADGSRGAPGNARFDVVQQTNRPNHFTLSEIWSDAKAVAAHSMAEATRRFRDTLGPMSGALYDERFFNAIE